jgi:hypothetical protein
MIIYIIIINIFLLYEKNYAWNLLIKVFYIMVLFIDKITIFIKNITGVILRFLAGVSFFTLGVITPLYFY